MSYYAVKEGKLPGIYKTWDRCKEQVHKFPGAKYKKFPLLSDAYRYMGTQKDVYLDGGETKQNTQAETDAEEQTRTHKKRRLSNSSKEGKESKESNTTNALNSNNKRSIQIYTDGSCDPNPGRAGSATFILFPDGQKIQSGMHIPSATNNIAELEAIRSQGLSTTKFYLERLGNKNQDISSISSIQIYTGIPNMQLEF